MGALRRFLADRVDYPVDLMAKEFMRTALPPILTEGWSCIGPETVYGQHYVANLFIIEGKKLSINVSKY